MTSSLLQQLRRTVGGGEGGEAEPLQLGRSSQSGVTWARMLSHSQAPTSCSCQDLTSA